MTEAPAAFRHAFGHPAQGVWAVPGRINLIGEHTDYNDGFALPIALPHVLTATAARRRDGVLRFRSLQDGHQFHTRVDELRPGAVTGWAAYPAGAVWTLLADGHPIGGLDLLVDSAIPAGAGLSSSAALTCAAVLAATQLHDIDLDGAAVARLAQRAENEFVGMPCGIMDQSAAMLAARDHALFLDTRSLRSEQVPLDLAGHGLALLTIDTRAAHRLVEGEYAARRRTCEHAARLLAVDALRDIGTAQLPRALEALPNELTRRRVRHVVTENARVLDTVDLLRSGRPRETGPLLTASHASLRDDYEVSVAEVDTAVEAALAAGALGARITGGGFGGCVIALVDAHRSDACADAVRTAFQDKGFTEPRTFDAVPSPGARRLPSVP